MLSRRRPTSSPSIASSALPPSARLIALTEHAEALITIAEPSFRDVSRDAARKMHLIQGRRARAVWHRIDPRGIEHPIVASRAHGLQFHARDTADLDGNDRRREPLMRFAASMPLTAEVAAHGGLPS